MNNQITKYSNTLLDLSNKSNLLDNVNLQMVIIKNLYKKEANFRLLFETKRINNGTKQNIIRKILADFDYVVVEFLCILIQQKGSHHLIKITDRFLILAKKELHANEIEITIAKHLDETTIKSLTERLKYTINVIIDPSVLGGIKLRRGNKIFDNSISYQLSNLKQTLYNL